MTRDGTVSETTAASENRPCRLRRLEPGDAAALARLAGDAEVARMTARLPHPYRAADAARFIEGLAGDLEESAFAIESGDRSDAPALIGVAGWRRVDGAKGAEGDVGYWLGKAHWGQGFATAAGRLLVARAFEDAGLAALRACVFQDNPGSARVLEKIGLRRAGACEGWSEARGRVDPTWLYRLERGAYEARR